MNVKTCSICNNQYDDNNELEKMKNVVVEIKNEDYLCSECFTKLVVDEFIKYNNSK